MQIHIGKHQVGEDCPLFIVAEVGSNWRTFEDCKNSIALAAKCGAHAVKFQAYTREALYGDLKPWGFSMPGTLPLAWLPKLKEKADACGIEFMCSAFSPELMEAVDPFVNCHKIASAEMTHVRMLEKARELGKPVILSTGASGEQDVKMALEVLGPPPTILMYCVAAYPANQVDLTVIETMREKFKVLVGYSDHTTDVLEIPYMAKIWNAVVLEKHVNFVGADGPDAPHSLDTDEFALMVSLLNGTIKSLGEIRPTKAETPMILRHNRRLIATRDIAEGDELREGQNFGIYRSLKDDTHAFSPFMAPEINGLRSRRAIKPGDGIGPGDV
jgi:N,N'-diacetyllegionaminate synthase